MYNDMRAPSPARGELRLYRGDRVLAQLRSFPEHLTLLTSPPARPPARPHDRKRLGCCMIEHAGTDGGGSAPTCSRARTPPYVRHGCVCVIGAHKPCIYLAHQGMILTFRSTTTYSHCAVRAPRPAAVCSHPRIYLSVYICEFGGMNGIPVSRSLGLPIP